MANRLNGCAHGTCGFGGTYQDRLNMLGTTDDMCARHNGGGNIAFADGHAKWYKSQMIKGKAAGGSIRFNGYELYQLQ
jgi:prepilin-type processing-associated H-X9-DG protein